ncbi:hypothetical protein [Clostridium felsineum]|uniref:hypothetical protein n=1 Tax=Clostridium felsineum TaxID=36839 RepID=UPI00098C8FE3|nr:hypothetical protein [Clostridium felsineum]URZ17344.1 hypothetical protein CLFE_033970 [Clostridium felsineum DSM 794]
MQFSIYTGVMGLSVYESHDSHVEVGTLNYGENFVDIGYDYNYGTSGHIIDFRGHNGWVRGYADIKKGVGEYDFAYWHERPLFTGDNNSLIYTITGDTTLYAANGVAAINLHEGNRVYCDANIGCDAMPGHTDRLRVYAFFTNGFCYAPNNIGYVDTGIAGAVRDDRPLVRGNW